MKYERNCDECGAFIEWCVCTEKQNPPAPSSPHQGCGKHSGCHLATGDTECGWPPCVRIGRHTQSSQPHQDYEDCSGCTDPRSEGTHQSHTKQHPCPPGGDPDCGYSFPTQSSSEKEANTTGYSGPPLSFLPNTSSEKECRHRTPLTSECTSCVQEKAHPNTEQEWKKRHYRLLEKMLTLFKQKEVGYSAVIEQEQQFIQELLEKTKGKANLEGYDIGLEVGCDMGAQTERARWINQPANEHDEKIRAAERARLRKLVEGMKKPNVAYVNIIRNRTLTDIFSLLEE